jgi:hypothetical protein
MGLQLHEQQRPMVTNTPLCVCDHGYTGALCQPWVCGMTSGYPVEVVWCTR